VGALVGVSAVFVLGWNEFTQVGAWRTYFLDLINTANKYGLMLLVPLTGLLFLTIRYLGHVIDIVLDVVNHFCFERTDHDRKVFRFEDEFDGRQLGFQDGQLQFARRSKIQKRMRQLLSYFAAAAGSSRPDLTVVSHSQGTIIAIEVLNDSSMDWIRQSFGSVRLVTMGSPFSHIYQHYFGNHYPRLDQPYWSMLRRNLDRWLNIFRVDDYVGTEIDFPAGLGASGGPSCENVPIERMGHNLYWSDKQVLTLLRDRAGFRWLTQCELDEARPAFADADSARLRNAA
jgi:hypothetical protein